MEDIIEEIVGDINDEYDNEGAEYKKISANQYELKGRYELVNIEEMLDVVFEDTDQVTIGGYLFNLFGRLPADGDKIEDRNFQYEIIKMNGAAVESVRLTVKEKPLDEEDNRDDFS
jgi:CBS domain containing-hemolysin-like protein